MITVKQLKQYIDYMYERSPNTIDDYKILIVADNGREGPATKGVYAKSADFGFDWDNRKLIITPEQELEIKR